MKEVKKVQHFIPRFILKKFTDMGYYNFYDKRYNKSYLKHEGNSMFKEFFYEHNSFQTNEIEDLLSERESIYKPLLEKIINKEFITKKEFNILLEFRHVTFYRSNEFVGFHEVKKSGGENGWMQRWDWKSLNSIYGANQDEQIKLSQLKAINSVINDDDKLGNVVRKVSRYTSLCFLFTSKDKKFAIGDNGSLVMGGEVDGVVLIPISPYHALMFPRFNTAVELMKKIDMNINQYKIIYMDIDNETVELANRRMIECAFEYYIDPNY